MADETGRILSQWTANREKDFPRNKIFLKRLSASLPPVSQLQDAHEEVFSRFDCLQCGNCCTNSSPVFTRTDVARIARFLGEKPGDFESRYLQADAEGDWIPKTKPCPMLESDLRCRVYEVRPKSCRGYPHTDGKEGWERPNLLARNTKECPAAHAIVARIRQMSES